MPACANRAASTGRHDNTPLPVTASTRRAVKGFNSSAGCTTMQCRKVHRCDVQLPNGHACASWTHNRAQHTGPKVEA